MRTDYNAFHSPIGAHSSFTLGCTGRNGGLGVELGGPAGDNVFIGSMGLESKRCEMFPFDESSDCDRERYVEDAGKEPGRQVEVRDFKPAAIKRDFRLGVDTWTAGGLEFAVFSPVESVPDPARAGKAELMRVLRPSVLAELTCDNRKGKETRRMFFGYAPVGGNDAVRHLDAGRGVRGVGQGQSTAIFTDDLDARPATAFTLQNILQEEHEFNYGQVLGNVAAIVADVPAGEVRTVRFAICFFRGGVVTTGLSARYFYSRYFKDIEAVGRYSLREFDAIRAAAVASDGLLAGADLSGEQRWQMVHAIRSYYGSTQLLEHEGRALWVVNEGEYRMMNTFDLTVDHVFYEMKMNPWVVRDVLDLFVDRYSYTDRVLAPGSGTEHPGGLSFAHDMGKNNYFTPPGRSAYEMAGLDGCFSHMTHEQLLNWVLCAAVYAKGAGDAKWLKGRLPIFEKCLRSMVNRDAPQDGVRNGLMGLDSSRCEGGMEITTYDSLDASLGQARNNGYMAVKGWAAYLAMGRIFADAGDERAAATCEKQAMRAARSIVDCVVDGEIPALLNEPSESRIIPAVEGLVFPWVLGLRGVLSPEGKYGFLVAALRTHVRKVLKKGVCLYPSGAWKLSSTADNSWLSEIYLNQFVVREILGIRTAATRTTADREHVKWLLADENVRWAWSDQMKGGLAKGSLYYPRGVTAVLWLEESVT